MPVAENKKLKNLKRFHYSRTEYKEHNEYIVR